MSVELVSFVANGLICKPTKGWVHPVHETKLIPFYGHFATFLPSIKAKIQPGEELTKDLMKTYGLLGASNSGPGCSIGRYAREFISPDGTASAYDFDERGFPLSAKSNSGYVGVTKTTTGDGFKFVAKLGTKHIGSYDTAEEAAAVRY
eukprot:58626-Prymnesium_polylepis.1